MGEILYANISHIDYNFMRPSIRVDKIPAGTKYDDLWKEIEDSVKAQDIKRRGFFSSDLWRNYKAKEDRWKCGDFIGTPEYIEKNDGGVTYIDGVWYMKPCLVIYFLNKDKHVRYFDTDDEMKRYIDKNFSEYKTIGDKSEEIELA